MTITLPRHVREALDHAGIYWGDRSAYIAQLIEKDLLERGKAVRVAAS